MNAPEVVHDDRLRRILRQTASVAIIGASDDPSRPSNEVARHLLEHAPEWELRFVNPTVAEVLGMPSHEMLADCAPVDLVCVFRRPDALVDVAHAAVEARCGVFWTQLGLRHTGAEAVASEHGLEVVMDRCLKIEHRRLRPFRLSV